MRVILVSLLLICLAPFAYAQQIKPGTWRVVLDHPGGGLIFRMDLRQTKAGPVATFVNGDERMDAEITRVQGNSLTVEFPSYVSSLTATLQPDGSLKGQVALTRRLGTVRQMVFPLTATFGQTYRFKEKPDPKAASMAGTWAVTMDVPGGGTRQGVALFKQRGARLTGTFMFVSGDYRFLDGDVWGREFYLSTFDGGQGTVWRGELQADGTLKGQWFGASYGFPPTNWTARRDPKAKLDDPDRLTFLKPGFDRFDFKFPDLDGKPVSIDDPRFKGKVVVVTIGGTWCPTCHDEAAFMAPFAKAHRRRGLEVIGLQFEYTNDFARSVEQNRRFIARYNIDYPMLIAGTSGRDNVLTALPMLNTFLVYPTTVIVDRKGKVRKIHTGFPGPATGDKHRAYVRDFRKLIDQLLAERP